MSFHRPAPKGACRLCCRSPRCSTASRTVELPSFFSVHKAKKWSAACRSELSGISLQCSAFRGNVRILRGMRRRRRAHAGVAGPHGSGWFPDWQTGNITCSCGRTGVPRENEMNSRRFPRATELRNTPCNCGLLTLPDRQILQFQQYKTRQPSTPAERQPLMKRIAPPRGLRKTTRQHKNAAFAKRRGRRSRREIQGYAGRMSAASRTRAS